jgi:1,4-alpha-glucan branching enzyme
VCQRIGPPLLHLVAAAFLVSHRDAVRLHVRAGLFQERLNTIDAIEAAAWQDRKESLAVADRHEHQHQSALGPGVGASLQCGLDSFSKGWLHYGVTRATVGGADGYMYREWAPGAAALSLVGDFNQWDAGRHPCTRDGFGVWSCFVPDRDPSPGGRGIPHDSFLKASVQLIPGGPRVTRLPAWTRYAVYDKALNEYVAKHWDPPAGEAYVWKHPRVVTAATADYRSVPGLAALPPAVPAPSPAAGAVTSSSARVAAASDPAAPGLRIYEAHVGMSGEEERVSSYRQFADMVLPRIHGLGYNCVQLMAVMEHAYYGSFGYHVTSFLAPSSRFGTPEDLKYLVDTAHGMGMLVIMDLVHSHAAKNVNDGLNMWDGTDHHYFHSGGKGSHDLWDSRLFDYGKYEVLRFLLSSARLFIEEFRFDGYRFDGITSMLYHHHGLSVGFSGDYNEYFSGATDLDACVYLMLANHMLHTVCPPALTIAEDVSGMPTLCRPVHEGGIGFDYRLGMAIPDKWIQLLKDHRDEDWDLGNLVFTLTNRRHQEKTIAYAESHDQALVGDKTTAFWLMDKEMYWHMTVLEQPMHPVVDRGVALHKMIRLMTYSLGGEAYLNFMGNEFGHPEWIDFPREGNNWSYKHCRRQWHLVDDDLLLYKRLNNFDCAMHGLESQFPWLLPGSHYVSLKHEADKMVVYDLWTPKGPLLFVFNFHGSNSYPDYKIGAPVSGEWVLALDSDSKDFGGHGRLDHSTTFHAFDDPWNNRPASLKVYAPSRSALVFKLKNNK